MIMVAAGCQKMLMGWCRGADAGRASGILRDAVRGLRSTAGPLKSSDTPRGDPPDDGGTGVPPERPRDPSLAVVRSGSPPTKSRMSELETSPAKNQEVTADYKNPQNLIKAPYRKPFEASYVANRPLPPLERAVDSLRLNKKTKFLKPGFDAYYDVVIIGGGAIGSSVAYWLAQRIYQGLKIAVIERDPSENIEMSLFGADFLRTVDKRLRVEGVDVPDVKFQPHGYLYLASEEGAEAMEAAHRTQIMCGAKVELMTPTRLKQRFPWLNTDDIALGSYGYENEGWFDAWSFLTALKLKAMDLGVHYIHGDVYNVAHTINQDKIYTDENEAEDEAKRIWNRPVEAHVHLPDGDVFPINSGLFVIAAGPQSGHVANLFGIGHGKGILQVPLPVEPRKRYVYSFHSPSGPSLATPLVIDPTGVYFRREGHGNMFICGRSPKTEDQEPSIENNDVDYDFFDNEIWPVLAHRVKAFENIKVKGAWAGFYDYNSWDQNAIVGNHPHHTNVLFATGCSGHGIQQAAAIGRATMEIIFDGNFQTLDLTRFFFDRILNDIQVPERGIV